MMASVLAREDIVIIGAGVVGSTTGIGLRALGHNVSYVDSDPDRLAELDDAGENASSCPVFSRSQNCIAMLCVPTPVRNGSYSLVELQRAVIGVTRAARQAEADVSIVIRSTIPPGTCDELLLPVIRSEGGAKPCSLAANPEFLRAASALEDFLNPRALLIGSTDSRLVARLRRLYGPLGKPIICFEDFKSAELAKCVHNLLNATAISFWSEVADVSERVGVESRDLIETVLRTAEAVWNPNYGTRIIGPFGGCLAKDVEGYIGLTASLGAQDKVARAVLAANAIDDPTG